MTADNSVHLAEAARRRSIEARSRANAAIRALDRDGATINYVTVAAAANVSRAFLYRDPALRQEIQQLRDTVPTTQPHQPAAQQTSMKSQIQLLDNSRAEVSALRQENDQLRHRLSEALGEQRAAQQAPTLRTPTRPNEPRRGHVPDVKPPTTPAKRPAGSR